MDNKLEDKNIIKSAIKIFDVLELVIEEKKATLTDVSEKTGYTKSTTQRILNTLKYLHYIDQDNSTYEYFPTMKVHTLGQHLMIDNIIKETSRKHLEKMAEEINETINLGILDGYTIIYLDKIVSTSPLRVDVDSSMNIPIYCSALGKSMAAFNSNRFSFDNNYIKYTNNTISSDEDFQKELQDIRKEGYAIDNEEFVEGLICVGMPILNEDNEAVASLSISIPKIRFENTKIKNYIQLLDEYTGRISKDLYKK
ncbi:MAG TPA: IclR family transcriptional regulator [Tissierellales bacterium]|nr:IclR family transcriptional regulator [Tissierellales bacterium]